MTNPREQDGPELHENPWVRYRAAFGEWALQVNLSNQAQEHLLEGGARVAAEHRKTAAEAAYRESRDWLTEAIASARMPADSNDSSEGGDSGPPRERAQSS